MFSHLFHSPPETKFFCPFGFCLLSRLSGEAREKKNFISWCQEAGILEVLPYHECDRLSRDQPDYLTCLVRLQVQNVSARYPIFITGETSTTLLEPLYSLMPQRETISEYILSMLLYCSFFSSLLSSRDDNKQLVWL